MKIKEEDLRRELEKALKHEASIANCASRLQCRRSYFDLLACRARAHGIDAVMHSNASRAYADGFKLDVVHYVLAEGHTERTAAIRYNLTYGVVCTWIKKYLCGGEEMLLSDRRGITGKMGRKPKPKLEDFEEGTLEYYKLKSEQLERENLLLKKALPLVQAAIRNRSKGKNDTSSSES